MSQELRYSVAWCVKTVNAFIEKYPRGWKNLKIIFPRVAKKLYMGAVYCLGSASSPRWERLKAVIKTLEGYERSDLMRYTHEDRILLYKYLGFCFDETFVDEEFTQNET